MLFLRFLERFSARNNFNQLVGDDRLTDRLYSMVSLSIISPALRVALSIADIRAPVRSCIFQQSREDLRSNQRGSKSARMPSSLGS